MSDCLPWFESRFEQLAAQYRAGQLHHGLLLQAAPGTGKADFARLLARLILCQGQGDRPCGQCQSCQLEQAGSHPDCTELQSDKTIGVDLIRQGIGYLNGTSQLSGAKVLIIHGADIMTEAASNALLKTLEEPTANTFLLLTTTSVDGLLPTLISRCFKISLPQPNLEQSRQWLKQQGLSAPPESVLKLYANAPMTLKGLIEQGELSQFDDFLTQLSEVRHGRISPMTLASDWQDNGAEVIDWLEYQARRRRYMSPAFHHQCVTARRQFAVSGANKSLILYRLIIGFLQSQTGA